MNFQASESVGRRPKTGPNVKSILQSIKTSANDENTRAIACNPAKMFKSLIQRANDSGSMDSSFEHKMLPRSTVPIAKSASFVNELRQVLKENKNIEPCSDAVANKKNVINETNITPSKLPFANRKNIDGNRIMVPKSMVCDKHNRTPKILERKMPSSSTPYRSKPEPKPLLDIPPMTPPNCNRFIDSDSEEANTPDLDRTLVKCFSFTRNSCRRLASFGKRDKSEISPVEPSSPQFKRRTPLSSSFSVNRSSLVSMNETSPLKRRHVVKMKSAKSPETICERRHTECDLTQTCNQLAQFIDQFDETELDRMQLLSEHNIDMHNNLDGTISGADGKIEFSFICEPSTSDIEEDMNVESANVMKYAIVENIPSIEVIAPQFESNHSSILLTKILNSSPFRRSISDPSLVRLANPYNSNEQHRITPKRISTDFDTASVELNLPTDIKVSRFILPAAYFFPFKCRI